MLTALSLPLTVQAFFIFDSAEFRAIDFLRPVYIPMFSDFFYINKVEQWKEDVATRVELIRI